jgi:hypothetical protein
MNDCCMNLTIILKPAGATKGKSRKNSFFVCGLSFIPLTQLFQVQRLCSAEFHSSVDHFAVGGVGEDFPHTVAAVTRVHASLVFGVAAVVFADLGWRMAWVSVLMSKSRSRQCQSPDSIHVRSSLCHRVLTSFLNQSQNTFFDNIKKLLS